MLLRIDQLSHTGSSVRSEDSVRSIVALLLSLPCSHRASAARLALQGLLCPIAESILSLPYNHRASAALLALQGLLCPIAETTDASVILSKFESRFSYLPAVQTRAN